MVRFFSLFLLAFFLFGCSNKPTKEVVVYVSQDQVFSEPILKEFQKETGIKVRALYDTEESKGTGVMNKLIAEKNNPQADVYWANEPIRAEVLKQRGLLSRYVSPNAETIPQNFKDPDGYWCGFSARARVLLSDAKMKNPPSSIFDYADPKYKANAVIANPLFGTTAVEVAALFVKEGDAKAKAFMQSLKTNKIAIATSNGESADFVAQKRYAFALVDSDDAISRIRAGKKVKLIYPDQGKDELGALILPNSVMLIKGAKHPLLAKKLIDYLLSKKVESALAKADCAQIPLHANMQASKELGALSQIKVMQVDYKAVAKKMQEIQPYLKKYSGL
ncbi:extracellular solute-binding protein [Sulfurimonas sp.]